MRKPERNNKKMKKGNFEEKLAQVVGEYRQAKELLDSLSEDDTEYSQQKVVCDKLYLRAETFIEQQK